MPTITTTVTSACASGVVTTQTTTQATPEPQQAGSPAALSPLGDFLATGDSVAMLLEVSTDNAAGLALVNKLGFGHTASVKKHGGYVKMINTGATSALGIYIFPSSAALIAGEKDYSANPDVLELASDRSIRMDAYFVGNVSAACKAHFDGVWGVVDGYNMNYPTDAAGGIHTPGSEVENAELFAYCGSFSMASKEAVEQYWCEARDNGALRAHDMYLSQQLYISTGPTKVTMFCLATRTDYLGLLDHVASTGKIAASFADATIDLFTSNGSPEVNAALKPWADLPNVNVTVEAEGSGFNDTGICGVHAKCFYRTAEDANAAAAKFGQMLEHGKKENTCMSGAISKYGDSGMSFFVLFKDEETWEKLDTFAAGLDGFNEVCIDPALHFTGVPFGHMSSNWRAQLNRWQDMWNIHWYTADTVDCSKGSAYSASAKSVCGWQEFHYETPEAMGKAIAASRTHAVQAAYRDHGVFWSTQKTGATSLLNCFAFPDYGSWAGLSDQLGALTTEIEDMLGAKKINCYIFGDGGNPAGAKAITDTWNALPQYDIRMLDLLSGYP